jgi:hypothetical protein
VKNIERTKKQEYAKLTSELGLVILCLFIISAPIMGTLSMIGTINRTDLSIIAIIFIFGAFLLSIISLSFFFMIWVDNNHFKNRDGTRDVIYLLFAFGTFFISLSFLIFPILLPSD